MAGLVSVNVGLPKDVTWQGRTVHTGIWKHPVEGSRMVRRLNIDGDGQGDLGGHGGEQRAVFVYQLQSYRYWQDVLGEHDAELGQYGENFTVDGLGDDEVCIGDRYRIGDAEFEVTQPRVTCFRVGLRLNRPEMPSLLVAHHRPGFYFRVIKEGEVKAGDEIVKLGTGPGALTVADTDALLYLPGRDPDKLRRALKIEALSPGWQQSFRDMAAPAPPPPAPAWAGFRKLRVRRVVTESPAVRSFYLEAEDGSALPPALPGQYLTLRLDGNRVRNYSLSSAPGAAYRLSVKREQHGSVSGYLHDTLRAGTVLDVAAPRGEFVLGDGTNPVLLISAGIGVTPVLAMLHALAAQGGDREVWWLHTTREPAQQVLADEARDLVAGLPGGHAHVFYTGKGDRLTEKTLAELNIPLDADAYLCGPEKFMTELGAALEHSGLSTRNIHRELFGALGAINPGVVGEHAVPPHQPAGPPGTGPKITFARSGLDVRWSDEQKSLLELAEACDVPTRWSCRTGVCHTCVTPVLSGTVDYTLEPLERPGPDEALTCCTRPASDLILDM